MATSKPFRCPHCWKSYKTQVGMHIHESMVHKTKEQRAEQKVRKKLNCKRAWRKCYKKYREGKDETTVQKRKASIEKYEATVKATTARKKYERSEKGKRTRKAYQDKLKKERREEKNRRRQTAVDLTAIPSL